MYDDFIKQLNDSLYKTTGKILAQQTTCHIHFRKMFEKLPITEGLSILNKAKKFEEFHPDNIKIYEKIIQNKGE